MAKKNEEKVEVKEQELKQASGGIRIGMKKQPTVPPKPLRDKKVRDSSGGMRIGFKKFGMSRPSLSGKQSDFVRGPDLITASGGGCGCGGQETPHY